LNFVPKKRLRESYSISQIIKGGWQLAGDHGLVEPNRVVQDMLAFVDAGITTFDCADIYTGVEELLGEFLTQLKQARGANAAQQVKIHTKYVPDRDTLKCLRFADVESVIDRSLKRLGQEQLDLVQFHWWNYEVPGHAEAIGHLEVLRQKGKINLIGVTNFDADHLTELCGVCDIASAQIQFSLLDTRAAGDFAKAALDNNVSLLVYGTLAGGFLTDAWINRPDPGFEFENRSLVKYRLIIDEFGGWDLFQSLLQALNGIARRQNADISTVAIRAMLDNSDVTAVIVGARYADRLQHTLRAFKIKMNADDRISLQRVLDQRQGPHGPVFGLERDTEGVHGRIMKYNLNKGDNRMIGGGAS
jgi:aryl-alcohol dehydrogenase-like predicted oxidoreductase